MVRGEGKGGERAKGEEGWECGPATPSSSVVLQKALLLCYLVVALSIKSATAMRGWCHLFTNH
jgi:hypothetical protein